ncbi:hypothetical protein JAAARDRAFT_32145 [Jaapia argillacea MUCL 33604]|uniref:YTH domain-containing protein n=1 Tax=Jaapia argillacea MUCL 33604 TaxID=933084 RepID=A0A067QEU0_9AGAM|nr:hypothetical protein JAAARDRAFT_32145 [Jaapia argillacea MUCL 33604]
MSHQIPSPPVPASQSSSGVRRHHTIGASSRAARATARVPVSEEIQQPQEYNVDEIVDEDWVGGLGAVGEKSNLHRQTSLPTRYNRALRQGGSGTPRTLNSLTAIAGHDGDEEDWEREMRGLRPEEELAANAEHNQHQLMDNPSSNASPLSPHFAPPHIPSPPPAGGAGVRRHQSLTLGAASAGRHGSSGLRRAGTLHTGRDKSHTTGYPQSPSPTNADEGFEDETLTYEDEGYFPRTAQPQPQQPQLQQQSQGQGQGNEWRGHGNNSGSNIAMDDVQRALSNLDIGNTNQSYGNNFPAGQSAHPPRFNPAHPPPAQAPGAMRSGTTSRNEQARGGPPSGGSGKLHLVTDLDGRKTPQPASASAYVPPIGHGGQPQQGIHQHRGSTDRHDRDRNDQVPITATGTTTWDQKERILGGRPSNPNLHNMYNGQQKDLPPMPSLPSQYLQQGQGAPRLGVNTNYGYGQPQVGGGNNMQSQMGMGNNAPGQNFITSPIDVPSLIAMKGYNPADFDTKPPFARFFVIKSYTEDDVHKSLKYEIWSSTDPGNKRLDKAFKETAGRGPIYLFFSVNASGHFCGMAEMMTPVDYTRSSTVWASDKWKGVFKVRWIFVRDIPNANLRHIRLSNTQERKPVTNSRDTQELPPDAGQEMLRIFHTHPARTSLLQDFAFYELQAMQKIQASQQGVSSPGQQASNMGSPQQQVSPLSSPQQHPFAMSNPNALAYAAQHLQMPQMPQMNMNPMMQMQMNAQFANPATMQSVMRHPSPTPMSGQAFLSMGSIPGFH